MSSFIDFEPRIIFMLLLGLCIVLVVSVEKFASKLPISIPMIYVTMGWFIFSLPLNFPVMDPALSDFNNKLVEYFSEFLVIISLMSAGLAIDRKFGVKKWGEVWPLLVVLMPLTVLTISAAGYYWLNLPLATSILLGACLSPTDPVLADSVHVGPPQKAEDHEVRFSLTAEAGLNDSLAFPFVYLAIAAIGMTSMGRWTVEWFLFDVCVRILIGSSIGYLIGLLISQYIIRFDKAQKEEANRTQKDQSGGDSQREGVIILGTVFSSYALAELFYGYGFLAVFISAVTIRQKEIAHDYQRAAHHFISQVEKIILIVVLISLGAILAGGVLSHLTVKGTLMGTAIVFLIRPLLGLLTMYFSSIPWFWKFAIAFFGVRGLGTIYYLSYGQAHGEFGNLSQIWSIAAFTILLSIFVHGVSSRYIMEKIESGKSNK